MAESKPTVTLKDGTKITLDDPSQIAQYSNREDLESITFGGDDDLPLADVKEAAAPAPVPATLINASLSIDTSPQQQTIATVGQPKIDPVVPKPVPAGDASTTITVTIGAIAGAASSAGMPALTNLAKNFIKGKLKLKGKSGGDSKPEEEKEEPTDCKTHQLKASAKFASISARISALENKGSGLSLDNNPLEDLEERIEKLEKLAKQTKKKR